MVKCIYPMQAYDYRNPPHQFFWFTTLDTAVCRAALRCSEEHRLSTLTWSIVEYVRYRQGRRGRVPGWFLVQPTDPEGTPGATYCSAWGKVFFLMSFQTDDLAQQIECCSAAPNTISFGLYVMALDNWRVVDLSPYRLFWRSNTTNRRTTNNNKTLTKVREDKTMRKNKPCREPSHRRARFTFSNV